jgi:hypothetical protein
MPCSLPQEPVHGCRTICAAPTQRGVGELAQHCATGRPETSRLGIDLAQEIVWHRHHDLRHNSQYTVVYARWCSGAASYSKQRGISDAVGIRLLCEQFRGLAR